MTALVGVAFVSLVIHHALPGEDADIGKVAAVGIDGERHLAMPYLVRELEVVLTVAGSDVHEAGASVLGNEARREARALERIVAACIGMATQGMARDQSARIDIGGAAPGIDARSGANVLRKRIGENELIAGLGPIVAGASVTS